MGKLTMNDPLSMSLAEAGEALRREELSPVTLTEASLARIEATDPFVNAFALAIGDEAVVAAREAETEIAAGRWRGPLHGVPVAVKDLCDMAGLPTTCSSKVRQNHIATANSTCVERLRAAGAIIVGKTHLHEFAYGITTPTSGNPWNPDYSPGGSSGGSAATVALRGCFMAVGTDTGGSIRIPSAVCGVTGLKPTFGRVSRFGTAPLSWSLDHLGPITRTARDAALCLQVLAGFDSRDSGSADEPVGNYLSGLENGVKGLRIGVPRNYFFEQVDPEIEDAVRAALHVLSNAGAILHEVEIPYTDQIMAVQFGLVMPEASAYHRNELRDHADLYEEDVRSFLEAGELFLATDYINTLRVRGVIQQAWRKLYENVDVIIGPAVASPATPRGAESVTWGDGTAEPITSVFVRLSAPGNITGLPSVAVPCGFTRNGLPVAFQAIGRPFDEATILRLAHTYQGETDWHLQTPPLALGKPNVRAVA
ncbi:amidase [Hoeflea sp. Naph1]|uniref:amidase n=1 Tax=Hoeflea sp. Naph1 TaxID=3388653 RepID=UPI0039902469